MRIHAGHWAHRIRAAAYAITLAACLALGLVSGAGAQGAKDAREYPNKGILVIVPFAPGAADVFVRAIAPALEAELGQPIVIENRPGANGAIAAEAVKRAAPDGYTLLFAPSSIVAARFVIKDVKFDACAEFTAIGTVHESPQLLAVYPGLGINSVAELIAFAKRNPGKLSFGTAGIGSVMHLNAEVFKQETGADIVHVPYRGAATFIPDLISGRLELTFSTLGTLGPQVSAGKLKALAFLDKSAHPALPGVPSISESVPTFRKVAAWSAILAPHGLPDAIRARLHQALEKVLALPEVRTSFEQNNGIVFSSKASADVAKLVCSEAEFLDRLTKTINLQPN
jgi:tripartite-type tricarboxylate transporter receptor subunit TctC